MEYRRLGTIALGVRTLRAFRTDRQHRLVGCVQTPGLSLLREARSPGVAFLAASHRYREGRPGAPGVVRRRAAARSRPAATFAAISAQGGR